MSDGYITDEFGKIWTPEDWDNRFVKFIRHCDSLGIIDIER